jgi:hypothetical protein
MIGAEALGWYFVLMPNFLILLIFAASGWLARFDDKPPPKPAFKRPETNLPAVIRAESFTTTAAVLHLDDYRPQSGQPMGRKPV